MQDPTLGEEVLFKFWKYAYRQRSRMSEMASLIEKHGGYEIISICTKLANPTQNVELTDEVRNSFYASVSRLFRCECTARFYCLALLSKKDSEKQLQSVRPFLFSSIVCIPLQTMAFDFVS